MIMCLLAAAMAVDMERSKLDKEGLLKEMNKPLDVVEEQRLEENLMSMPAPATLATTTETVVTKVKEKRTRKVRRSVPGLDRAQSTVSEMADTVEAIALGEPDDEEDVEPAHAALRKRACIFAAAALLLGWAGSAWLAVVVRQDDGGPAAPYSFSQLTDLDVFASRTGVALAALVFVAVSPTLAMLIARFATKEGLPWFPSSVGECVLGTRAARKRPARRASLDDDDDDEEEEEVGAAPQLTKASCALAGALWGCAFALPALITLVSAGIFFAAAPGAAAGAVDPAYPMSDTAPAALAFASLVFAGLILPLILLPLALFAEAALCGYWLCRLRRLYGPRKALALCAALPAIGALPIFALGNVLGSIGAAIILGPIFAFSVSTVAATLALLHGTPLPSSVLVTGATILVLLPLALANGSDDAEAMAWLGPTTVGLLGALMWAAAAAACLVFAPRLERRWRAPGGGEIDEVSASRAAVRRTPRKKGAASKYAPNYAAADSDYGASPASAIADDDAADDEAEAEAVRGGGVAAEVSALTKRLSAELVRERAQQPAAEPGPAPPDGPPGEPCLPYLMRHASSANAYNASAAGLVRRPTAGSSFGSDGAYVGHEGPRRGSSAVDLAFAQGQHAAPPAPPPMNWAAQPRVEMAYDEYAPDDEDGPSAFI